MNAVVQEEPSMEEILDSIRKIISDDGDQEGIAEPEESSAPPPSKEELQESILELTKVIEDDGTITDLKAQIAAAQQEAANEEPLILDVEEPIVDDIRSDAEKLADIAHEIETDLDDDESGAFVAEEEVLEETSEFVMVDEDAEDAPQDQDIDGIEEEEDVIYMEEPVAEDDIPEEQEEVETMNEANTVVENDDNALLSGTTAASALAALGKLKPEEEPVVENTAPAPQNDVAGSTVEDLTTQLLRPMLKDWLDKNLPSLVEKAVQQEIEKLGRKV